MVTLSFSLWELAVFLIAIAIIVGTVQLVKVFKNLSATLENTNKILDDNRAQIKSIIGNADEMTEEGKSLLKDAHGTVNHISEDVVNPLVTVVSNLVNIIGKFNSVGSKSVNLREKRLEKATKKAKRQAKKAA